MPAVAPLRAAQGFRKISVLTDNAELAAAAQTSLATTRAAIAEGNANA